MIANRPSTDAYVIMPLPMPGLKRKTAELASRVLAGGLNALGSLSPLNRLMLMTGRDLRLDQASVATPFGPLRFHAANEVTLHRVETFFTKEPETIAWIDSLDGGVLYDIGANVGTYSLYAALSGKASQAFSFEPESQNYALLNRNIALNALDDKVTAFNIPLSDRTHLDRLHLSVLDAGAANHSLGASVDYNGRPRPETFRQGAVSFSLDDFIATFSPPFPNHLKLDVDGIEPAIIAGAKRTLADARVKSLLIEINEDLPEAMGIVATLKSLGFTATKNDHARMFDGGPYDHLYNYVFRRPAAR